MNFKSKEDIERIKEIFRETISKMNELGLREPSPYINNTKRFWGKLTNDFIGDSKLKDCGEQTEYMTDILKSYIYDDTWDFDMNAGFGHAWGYGASSNADDPIIWFDTRSEQISVGSPCQTCKPWFGKPVYTEEYPPHRPPALK